jgi:16S rRNA (uracil1498-N3)-methyltransferase
MPKNLPAFFVAGTLSEGAVIDLPEDERRHARARRLRVGSAVRLSDAAGNVASGTVSSLSRGACAVAVGTVNAPRAEPGGRVSLYVPAIRLPRLSWLVEKATELGAARVTIVASERAQRDRVETAARSGERLERIVREAAKQSGQTSLPEVSGPIRFEEAARAAAAHASAILLDASGPAFPSALAAPLALWIGPEGGWSPDELSTAEHRGWMRARLPGAVLRAETAAVAALVLALRSIDTADPVGGQ